MLEVCVSLLNANGFVGGQIPAFGGGSVNNGTGSKGKGKGRKAKTGEDEDEDDGGSEVPVALVASVVHNALGELLLDGPTPSDGGKRVGDVAAAAASFDAALSFWPNNSSALLSLAHLDREQGNLEAALARLTSVVEYVPPFAASVSGTQLNHALDADAAGAAADETDGRRQHADGDETPGDAAEVEDRDGEERGEEEQDWDWRDGLVANPHMFCLSVASYHLAHLLSRLGEHEKAAPIIASMGMKYRLAPEVWDAAHRRNRDQHSKPRGGGKGKGNPKTSAASTAVPASKPTVYTNAVPPAIKNALLQGFSPAAQYWEQNGYDAREYFSWWYDPAQPPSSAVEKLIQHLAPLTGLDNIVGAEWWTHSREIKGDFGHQLHFDMEERTLENDGVVIHPAVSSVVYLCGAEGSAGPTLVLDQTMDDTAVAGHGWLVHPVDGAFMMFKGDLLHGVIPSKPQGVSGASSNGGNGSNGDGTHRVSKRARTCKGARPASSSTPAGGEAGAAAAPKPVRRLTLMIGWWAGDDTSVIALGAGRRPHAPGPQSAVPRPTSALSWPATLGDGTESTATTTPAEVEGTCISLVKPAWEAIQLGERPAAVELPTSVDQRFFIKGASDFKAAVFSEHCA